MSHPPAPVLFAPGPTRNREGAGRARSGVQECRDAESVNADVQVCRVQDCRSVRVQGAVMQGVQG